MSHWNYLVVERDGYLAIHEGYYDNSGKVRLITEDSVSPGGDNLDELREDMEMYVAALDKPVVRYEDIVASTPSKRKVMTSIIAAVLGIILIIVAWLIWSYEPPMLGVTVLSIGILAIIYAVAQFAYEHRDG